MRSFCMELQLSAGAGAVIAQLNQAGFAAYAVGGCVRDLVMGKIPEDYDIATAARPEQIRAVFERTIDTGARYGTITVMMEGEPIEVTTFRKEADYLDGRHPSRVEFVGELRQDVLRRDFTINGLAFHPEEGLIDLVGGLTHIRERKVRTIGDPDRRFAEDGLRILRAVRFTCVLDFVIGEKTRESMERNREKLLSASVERIWEETRKALICRNGRRIGEFTDILQLIFPELAPAIGFEQHHPYHHLGVWQHTLLAFARMEPDLVLRTAILFHDSGKPLTCTMGEDGKTHFPGHPEEGVELAERALARMKCDRKTMERVLLLIRYHDIDVLEDDREIKRWLNKLGERAFWDLLKIKRADNAAKHPDKVPKLMAQMDALESRTRAIIQRGDCFSRECLAVTGEDLMAIGMQQGEQIGKTLDALLHLVILEELPNQREALLERAREMMEA